MVFWNRLYLFREHGDPHFLLHILKAYDTQMWIHASFVSIGYYDVVILPVKLKNLIFSDLWIIFGILLGLEHLFFVIFCSDFDML